MKAKTDSEKEIFANRLLKNYKHLSKWARRSGIYSYRLYDKDVPGFPLLIELYTSVEKIKYLVVSIYKSSSLKSDDIKKDEEWLEEIAFFCASIFSIEKKNVFCKMRGRSKGDSQYQKIENVSSTFIITKEGSALFYLNLSDYIDIGLFLDMRDLRLHIGKIAKNKDLLNLFSYTASFSIHAMLGGARSLCSVDSSNTAIKWAKKNMALNGIIESSAFELKKMDVMSFLKEARKQKKMWDVIICDAPTFSNSKNRKTVFDVKEDYIFLALQCIKLLKKGGVLYFSSNARSIKFDSSFLKAKSPYNIFIKDISSSSIPKDFRNKKIHKAWKIVREE